MKIQTFSEQLDELITLLDALRSLAPQVEQITDVVQQAVLQGRTIYTCGNGGSATDAMHLAQEVIGRFRKDSARGPLPAVCLNADVGALTCIGNDYGFDQVFARQLAGLAQPGDVLVVFSTSGNSPNVLHAVQAARDLHITTIGFLGKGGGRMAGLVDYAFIVPSPTTARIQEVHTLLLHAICERIEEGFLHTSGG